MNMRKRRAGWMQRTYGALLLALFCAFPACAADTVALVLSEPGGAYSAVASEVRNGLRGAAEIREYSADDGDGVARSGPRVIVAIGTHACRSMARSRSTGPVLCLLIPRAAYESIAAGAAPRSISAIVLDQPVARQMAFIRAALPAQRDVAVLLGEESAALAHPLAQSAAQFGLRLATRRVADPGNLSAALESALNEADVLLAVPDAAIYNSTTLQNILRTAFLSKVPLVAFSPAYVRAGAIAAIYTTPAQVGRQAVEWLNQYLAGRSLPAAQSSREFEISVNRTVARALGISIDEESRLADRLRQMEHSR